MKKEEDAGKVRYWLPVLAYAALIFYLSSLQAVWIPQEMEKFDPEKFSLHLAEYAPLGFLLLRALVFAPQTNFQSNVILSAAAIGALYGLSDELHQYFVPSRTASIVDLLADSLGSLLGALAGARKYKS